jgi:hypothetical protein
VSENVLSGVPNLVSLESSVLDDSDIAPRPSLTYDGVFSSCVPPLVLLACWPKLKPADRVDTKGLHATIKRNVGMISCTPAGTDPGLQLNY